MSNNNDYQEFSPSNFTMDYGKNYPEVLDLKCIMITKPDWTIYPGENQMPKDSIYYVLPNFYQRF